MSATLSSVAVTLFDTQVKQAYQDSQKLRNTVYVKTTKSANKMTFRKIGKGTATLRGTASSDVAPMNIEHSTVEVALQDYVAPEYTDVFNQADVNFSEIKELGEVISNALGRRSDQMILDALANATQEVGTSGAALTVATLLDAKKALDKAGVPSADRTLVIEAKGLEDLLNTTEVTSADYNTVKALVAGDVNTFVGFKIVMLADRSEGGIPDDGTDYTGYVYHKRAVGFALNLDISTKIDWVPQKLSHLSVGTLKANAALIDDEGVVKIKYGM